jgi:uncharacterized membrane protein
MMGSSLLRARALGAVLALVVFCAGAVAGFAYAGRRGPGVVMTLTTTDEIPQELERLGLSDEQRIRIRRILRDAQPRVFAILNEMEPRMRATLAATDAEISGLLDPRQRERWEAFRRQHPPRLEEHNRAR